MTISPRSGVLPRLIAKSVLTTLLLTVVGDSRAQTQNPRASYDSAVATGRYKEAWALNKQLAERTLGTLLPSQRCRSPFER